MSRLSSNALRSLKNRLPPAAAHRLRPAIGAARRAQTYLGGAETKSTETAPSPNAQWHGPGATTSGSSLVCTPVADILLLQGKAPAASKLEIRLANDSVVAVPHRFAHPNDPSAPADCFELTLDHSVLDHSVLDHSALDQEPGGRGTLTATLIVDGTETVHTVELPRVPSPGAMVGVETLDKCPACTNTSFRPAGRRQHLQMVTCLRCQLVMTNPRPAEDHTLVRYSERYFQEEYLPSQQLSPSLAEHIDSILDHSEPAKALSPTLFELGVGGGNLSARAKARGWRVRGTDVNPASVAHARDRGLDVWVENADHADSLGGTYGAVISEMSIEHVRRPDHFCSLAANALVPGGRLVVYTVSGEGASFEQSGMASPLVGPAEHLFLFSAGSLVALCERHGLRVDHVWRNNTGDEIGIVATKRTDRGNPAVASG